MAEIIQHYREVNSTQAKVVRNDKFIIKIGSGTRSCKQRRKLDFSKIRSQSERSHSISQAWQWIL